MLVDLAQAVGGYLHDVFEFNFDWWVVLGLVAQAMFTMRFVVQWLASERAGRSVIPIAFWFFSIAGGVLLLGYALYRKDLGLHPRAGLRHLRLCAQSLSRVEGTSR